MNRRHGQTKPGGKDSGHSNRTIFGGAQPLKLGHRAALRQQHGGRLTNVRLVAHRRARHELFRNGTVQIVKRDRRRVLNARLGIRQCALENPTRSVKIAQGANRLSAHVGFGMRCEILESLRCATSTARCRKPEELHERRVFRIRLRETFKSLV